MTRFLSLSPRSEDVHLCKRTTKKLFAVQIVVRTRAIFLHVLLDWEDFGEKCEIFIGLVRPSVARIEEKLAHIPLINCTCVQERAEEELACQLPILLLPTTHSFLFSYV